MDWRGGLINLFFCFSPHFFLKIYTRIDNFSEVSLRLVFIITF